jgi:hypothetical protein
MKSTLKLNNNLDKFLSKWQNISRPSLELVNEYLLFCNQALMADETLFLEVVSLLRKNIEMWSHEYSEPYLKYKPFYCKEDLEDKRSWYVSLSEDDSVDTHTSGSSTGFHFTYRRMKSTFELIEWDNHYDMLLDEFSIRSNPNVLYFFPNYFKKIENQPIFLNSEPQPYLNSHGRSRKSIVHYANFDMYKSNPLEFFKALFDHISKNDIDVFFSSGPQINSLCYYIKKLGFNRRIGKLLSQTNEMLLQDDAKFLFGYFDGICDHMRCWDGGASFFTCRFGNYHLMDNLSWCDELDGKIISTDYFNFSSPFIRYWNGDMCQISKKFSRCECGRLFREFEFLENRPFSLGGVCLGELRNKMMSLGIKGIKQVKCYVDSINIVSSRELSRDEKNSISDLEPSFFFKFSSEIE